MNKIYLFLLSALIGCELALGMVVAPTLFGGSAILQGLLPEYDKFHAGLLMGRIFHQFGYALLAISVISFVREIWFLFERNASFYLRFSRFCISLIVIFCAGLFVFYFMDFILDAQSAGDTATAEFGAIHKASEYVFKLILCAQCALVFAPSVAASKRSDDESF